MTMLLSSDVGVRCIGVLLALVLLAMRVERLFGHQANGLGDVPPRRGGSLHRLGREALQSSR